MKKKRSMFGRLYTPLPPRYTRLFKLDLDQSNHELSGIITPFRLEHGFVSADENKPGVLRTWASAMYRDVLMMGSDNSHSYMYNGLSTSGYDALSYSWGEIGEPNTPLYLRRYEYTKFDSDSQTLEPHGKVEAEARILIRPAQRRFLEFLRRTRYQKWIWIDCVCMDQASTNLEHEFQMHAPLMNDIYGQANETLAWLGGGNRAQREALERLDSLNSKLYQANKQGQPLIFRDPNNQNLSELGLPACQDPIWYNLSLTINKPWFRRLWTLQEMIIPEKVSLLLGSEEHEEVSEFQRIGLETLQNFGRLAGAMLGWIIVLSLRNPDNAVGLEIFKDPLQAMWQCRETFRMFRPGSQYGALQVNRLNSKLPLSLLLPYLRSRESERERDKVYGAMGLLPETSRKAIHACTVARNADRSNPIPIYVAFAEQFIAQAAHPAECILNYVESPSHLVFRESDTNVVHQLPSWCPDLFLRAVAMPLCWDEYRDVVFLQLGKRAYWGFSAGFDLSKSEWTPKLRHYRNREFRLHGDFDKYRDGNYRSDGRLQIKVLDPISTAKSDSLTAYPRLEVTGVHIDYIERVVASHSSVPGSRAIEKPLWLVRVGDFLDWETNRWNLSLQSLTGKAEEIRNIHARTIIANFRALSSSENDRTAPSDIDYSHPFDVDCKLDTAKYYLQCMETIKDTVKHKGRDILLSDIEFPVRAAQDYMFLMLQWGWGRTFFSTRNGRVGIGPASRSFRSDGHSGISTNRSISGVRVGDQLCVLFFCPTPYLLREENGATSFVGETYVHDLMHSQALDMVERDELQMQTWHLS